MGKRRKKRKKERSSTARSFVHENWPENELPAYPLIKARSERTKARHTLSSLNGVLISDGFLAILTHIVPNFSEYSRVLCAIYVYFKARILQRERERDATEINTINTI